MDTPDTARPFPDESVEHVSGNEHSDVHPLDSHAVDAALALLGVPKEDFEIAIGELTHRRKRVDALNQRLNDENVNLTAENARLRYESTHDHLTGLVNKETWKANIEDRMKAGKTFGILFIDLDSFGAVNGTLGHETADRLLERFGQHLLERFRRKNDALEDPKDHFVGRYGGDEAGVTFDITENGNRRAGTLEDRMKEEEAYANQVVKEFVEQQPQAIRDVNFNASVGTAVWEPGMEKDVSALIAEADEAMYQNKRARKANGAGQTTAA